MQAVSRAANSRTYEPSLVLGGAVRFMSGQSVAHKQTSCNHTASIRAPGCALGAPKARHGLQRPQGQDRKEAKTRHLGAEASRGLRLAARHGAG